MANLSRRESVGTGSGIDFSLCRLRRKTQTKGTSDQVEASTPWSALAWQRFGPTDLAGLPWLSVSLAQAKAAPGRRTPRS